VTRCIALCLPVLLSLACKNGRQDTEPPNGDTGGAAGMIPKVAVGDTVDPEDCAPLAEAGVAEENYELGVRRLEEARDGEHFLSGPFADAMDKLEIAARNGHLEAMSLYGSTQFGTMFTNDAPQADEREQYVWSIAFLRIAALAGDETALSYMPGLTAKKPDTSVEPLSEVPEDWVQDAFAEADLWIACNGLPKPKADEKPDEPAPADADQK
jgi:hypothetical protein